MRTRVPVDFAKATVVGPARRVFARGDIGRALVRKLRKNLMLCWFVGSDLDTAPWINKVCR